MTSNRAKTAYALSALVNAIEPNAAIAIELSTRCTLSERKEGSPDGEDQDVRDDDRLEENLRCALGSLLPSRRVIIRWRILDLALLVKRRWSESKRTDDVRTRLLQGAVKRKLEACLELIHKLQFGNAGIWRVVWKTEDDQISQGGSPA